MFFSPPQLGRIEGAEVLQLACGRTNRQRQTVRAETQCESFAADLGLIVASQPGCWFKGFFFGFFQKDGRRGTDTERNVEVGSETLLTV